MMFVIDLFVLFTALVFGSFFNVVAIRLLKKESVAYPPSHCPHCEHRLGLLDLIPLGSFLLLRGRCRYCRETISPLYPFGEGLTAVIIFLVYRTIGFSWELLPALVLAVLLILAVLTDIREKLILDVITIPGLLLLLIIRLLIGTEPFWFYVLGGVTGFGLLLLLAVVSKGGMGGGDIKLFAAIGVALGPWLTIMSLVLAALAGTIVGVILLVAKKMDRKQPIPFGPFILIGTITAYLYGTAIWNWYITLLL